MFLRWQTDRSRLCFKGRAIFTGLGSTEHYHRLLLLKTDHTSQQISRCDPLFFHFSDKELTSYFLLQEHISKGLAVLSPLFTTSSFSRISKCHDIFHLISAISPQWIALQNLNTIRYLKWGFLGSAFTQEISTLHGHPAFSPLVPFPIPSL